MSKTRLISSLTASLGILAAACWIVTAVFPLAAAPETVSDAQGVSVDLNGATLLHRAAVAYPAAARERGIQGAVLVQVKIDGSGNVADAQVLTGPEELRKAALQSVLTWHFTSDSAGGTRQVTIAFQLPAGEVRQAAPAPAPAPAAPLPVTGRVPDRAIESVRITGLSEQATADLTSRLPKSGETLSAEGLQKLRETVRSFDEHLAVSAAPSGANVRILISPPPPPPPAIAVTAPPTGRIRVGGNVQAMKLVSQPKPAYPAEAKSARIQGVVQLLAIIAKDGTVENLTVISGHPLLAAAAIDAVRQWVYQPTTLNGEPIGVETEIDVNFTLAQ